jgi:hypothetical protein
LYLYIHSPIRLHDLLLNYLSTGTTLPLHLPLPSTSRSRATRTQFILYIALCVWSLVLFFGQRKLTQVVTFLACILGVDTELSRLKFFVVSFSHPPVKCRDSSPNYVTTNSFLILTRSLFIVLSFNAMSTEVLISSLSERKRSYTEVNE